MQRLNNEKQKITGGTSQRSCYRVNTARNTKAENIQLINTSICVTNTYVKEAKDRSKESKHNFYESETHFEQFSIDVTHEAR